MDSDIKLVKTYLGGALPSIFTLFALGFSVLTLLTLVNSSIRRPQQLLLKIAFVLNIMIGWLLYITDVLPCLGHIFPWFARSSKVFEHIRNVSSPLLLSSRLLLFWIITLFLWKAGKTKRMKAFNYSRNLLTFFLCLLVLVSPSLILPYTTGKIPMVIVEIYSDIVLVLFGYLVPIIFVIVSLRRINKSRRTVKPTAEEKALFPQQRDNSSQFSWYLGIVFVSVSISLMIPLSLFIIAKLTIVEKRVQIYSKHLETLLISIACLIWPTLIWLGCPIFKRQWEQMTIKQSKATTGISSTPPRLYNYKTQSEVTAMSLFSKH